MFKKTLAAVGGAALVAMAMVAPASAQDPGRQEAGARGGANSDAIDAPARRTTPTRTPRREGRQQAPAAPTPEENIAAAQAVATSASLNCQVTEANLLGQTAEGAKSYEAACATGPGYILIGSTPPQAVDCVLLTGQAELSRSRDPAADVGTQCTLPQNTDVLRVMTSYAAEAGVACTVDQGGSIGRASSGNLIYEVGCNGVDGYWLEKAPTGWVKTECSVIATQNASCRYSTADEAAATLKSRFAGSDAAACDVTQSRYMGSNANGSFYEAKCGAGNGVIVRFDTAFAVQQVYACEVAHRIGGGCTLTQVPPLEETAAPQQ